MQTEDSPVTDHRTRLLQGLAQSVATKGYADTTIADIVREAGVSRRTFYEQFDGKPAALIALYESASRRGLQVLKEAIDPARDWQTQVDQALSAYLSSLAQNPVLLRTLFVEILGLGATGVRRASLPSPAASARASCLPPHLPTRPKGRTIVIGAGKASAAMARALEDHWDGPLEGLVVTRYGYEVPCERIEIVQAAHPVPDAAGLRATQRIQELVRA
jgi:AcrR family transcriptional regulator